MIATTKTERSQRAPRTIAATRATSISFAHWGLASVLVLFAYEWLLSAFDKLFSTSFRSGLAANLRQALHDNPNHWYARVMNWAVVPHAALFAVLVEAGELLVAAGLIAGAVLWLTEHRLPAQWAALLHLAVIGALLGSALMTANYYWLAGNRWPWFNTAEPFNEGLSIDGLLTLIALALLAVQVNAWRARRSLSGPARR